MDTNSSIIKTRKDLFLNLKSDFFIRKVFTFLTKKAILKIIKVNKKIQQRLNININYYKEYYKKYSSIEIEIIPSAEIWMNILLKLTKVINHIIIYLSIMKKKK